MSEMSTHTDFGAARSGSASAHHDATEAQPRQDWSAPPRSQTQTQNQTEIQTQATSGIDNARLPIGVVRDVAGGMCIVVFDPHRLDQCQTDADPSIAMSGQVSSQIKIRVGSTWLLGVVRTLRQALSSEDHGGVVAEVDFMGEGDTEQLTGNIYGFRRGVTRYPSPGALAHVATRADLKQIYASDGRANIGIGTVHPTRDIRAGIYIDSFLGKHFALLGSTGTGKSTSASLILHRICELAPQGHIVMIDPHGEYISAFKDRGHLLDVSNLQMPYWLMNFEEHCEVFLTSSGSDRVVDADILARCVQQARSKNRLAVAIGKITVDSPIPYLLSDLLNILLNEMGKLDKGTGSIPYQRIKSKIEEIRGDARYQFMFSGMLVGDSMTDFIAQVFRLPAKDKPISIIDVSGVPSEITQTVVAVLSRLVFDFAVWARDEETRPILLVCEEAHRYVPAERNADGSSVARVLSRIAKEGRKYGVSLGLITQRPSDLAEGVLSQCGTIIAMRLNNERDQAHVRAAMPEGARGFMDAIPALRNRECIVCGEGVSIPMRVSFDDLDAALRPASADPSFATQWAKSGGEEAMIERTTQRWRAQSR